MNRSRPLGLASSALALGSALVALLSFGACTKKEAPAPSPPPAAQAPGAAAPTPAGDLKPGANPIKGTVKLNGTAPEMRMLKREADPFCGRVPMKDEEVIVGPAGGLKN